MAVVVVQSPAASNLSARKTRTISKVTGLGSINARIIFMVIGIRTSLGVRDMVGVLIITMVIANHTRMPDIIADIIVDILPGVYDDKNFQVENF